MAADLSALVPLFAESYHAAKPGRFGDACRRGAGFVCASHHAVLEVDLLKDLAKSIRKESAGFAGGVQVAMAAQAAMTADPVATIRLTKVAWDMLKVKPFTSGPRLSIAAAVLAERVGLDDLGLVAGRARDFYAAQRKDHSIITSADDYVPSVLLATTPMEVSTGATITENMYRRVKPWFGYNDAQALAQVLVIGGALERDPGPLVALRNALGRQGVKAPDAGVLGLLALVQSDHEWLSEAVAQVARDLDAAKVVPGRFSKTPRHTLAMALVALAVADDEHTGLVRAVYLNNVARVVAEEQAAAASAAT